MQTAGLGEPIQSAGDLEVAQWLDGQIIHGLYPATDKLGSVKLADTSSLQTRHPAVGFYAFYGGDEKELKVESETVFEERHPFLYSFRQVERGNPNYSRSSSPLGTLALNDGPVFATCGLCIRALVNVCTGERDQLGGS